MMIHNPALSFRPVVRPFPSWSAAQIIAICLTATLARAQDDDDGFKPLFNGKDLNGWVLVNTPSETWTVKDGMLLCTGKPIGEIRTEKMYQNFILEVEWRHMKPKGNAGIFVWADDITARGVPFHRSVEVQVLENDYGNTRSYTTHGDIFPIHGARMTPLNGRGGGRAFPTENRSKPSPQWNHYRITCMDGMISLAVNGKIVTRGKNASPSKGYICLESEGGIVHYRNLKIKELPSSEIKASDIATQARGFKSIYTGLDLSGWRVSDAVKKSWRAQDWTLRCTADRPASLTTVKQWESFEFLFDCRLSKGRQMKLALGKSHVIEFSKDDQALAKLMRDSGQWNRIVVRQHQGLVTTSVNGRVWKKEPVRGAKKHLALMPDGPCDFANLFVRQLNRR